MDIETVIAEVQETHARVQKPAAVRGRANIYALTDDQLHEVLRRKPRATPTPRPVLPEGPKKDPNETGPTPTPPPGAGSISPLFDSAARIAHDPDPWT